MKYLFVLIAIGGLWACQDQNEISITNPEDYNSYLTTELKESFEEALSEKEFWSKRLRPDSSGVGDLGPLANAYTGLFETTGDAMHLRHAETLLKKAISVAGNNKDTYERSLARNYISQHRFAEARDILEKSYEGVSNKRLTEFMLFDVYMELGWYEEAYEFLSKTKDASDYNYLIRLSKWSDHKGNLDAAITYMEKAKDIADSRDSKPLKIWTYSNLGDYYGHAGRIQDAYTQYLNTLALQPDNAYVKKGIAWIAYSAEENTEEAGRILDSVMRFHKVPDYFLLKSELAEFEGNASESEAQSSKFLKAVSEGNYGDMYNGYLIEMYAESQPEKALQLAEKEVSNRATPETYHLLALAQLGAGQKEVALNTLKSHVVGKTSEPMASYHTALVYRAHGMARELQTLKDELLEASFELGPVLTEKIKNL